MIGDLSRVVHFAIQVRGMCDRKQVRKEVVEAAWPEWLLGLGGCLAWVAAWHGLLAIKRAAEKSGHSGRSEGTEFEQSTPGSVIGPHAEPSFL